MVGWVGVVGDSGIGGGGVGGGECGVLVRILWVVDEGWVVSDAP